MLRNGSGMEVGKSRSRKSRVESHRSRRDYSTGRFGNAIGVWLRHAGRCIKPPALSLGLDMSHIFTWTPEVHGKSFASPEGAAYHSPGQRPGLRVRAAGIC